MQQVLLQDCIQNTTSSNTAIKSKALSHSSPIEKDKCQQLLQLIHQKETLSLQDLESLRKQIESHQQIQMTIKNNNPYKVHIQCKHFKSKKCTFQITFKAINAPTQMNAQLQSNSYTQQNIISSSSTYIPQNCSLQPQQNNPQFSSSSNTFPSSPNKKDQKQFSKEQVSTQANAQQTTSSSSSQEGERNAAAKQQPGDSCTSVSVSQQANLAEINLSSQVLLQNLDEMKEENDLKQMLEVKEIQQVEEEQIIEDENNESFLNMIDEQQMDSHHYSLLSPTMSPFIFNIISSNNDINFLSIDGAQEVSTQFQQQLPFVNTINLNNTIAGSNGANTAIQEENSKIEEEENTNCDLLNQQSQQEGFQDSNIILFKLSNCRLQHRNHPVMSDEEYKIHLAKRWLEGHSEKIEKIYEEIREKKGMSFKITPKIIKKFLLDAYDIDIYAKCTEKAHKKYLKKKLDNLMKAIRQKEKSSKKTTATSSIASIERITRSSSLSSSSEDRIQSKKSKTKSSNSGNKSQKIQQETSGQTLTSQNNSNVCNQQTKTQSNIEEQKQAETPTSDMKKEGEINNSTQNQLQQQQLQVQQQKVYKEEWESFLEIDVNYRLQPAH